MRAGAKWVLAGLTVPAAVVAWTAGWSMLEQHAGLAVDQWIAEEQARGRTWTCAERTFTGYPFSLTLQCASPTLKSESGVVAVASSLRASSSITDPRRTDFELTGPLRILAREDAAKITWKEMGGSLMRDSSTPDVALFARDLHVDELQGSASDWSGSRAGALALRVRKAPDRAPGSGARELMLDVQGLKAPAADALVGNDALLKADLSALVLNADVPASGSLAERIDRWVASGGRVQINSLNAEKGESRVQANGDVWLDERRRPTGKVSVRMAGIQPILASLNMPAAPLAIEGLLRGSSGRANAAALLENRTLPIEMRNGRVYIGPIRTPVALPPLL